MSDDKRYEVNFFKPLSNHAKANTKLIIVLATIWAVAVFGFQFLLMVLNEPTPEDAYTTFTKVWPEIVKSDNVKQATQEEFSKSLLYVLGKNIAVSDEHKSILRESLSQALYNMQVDSLKPLFKTEPNEITISLAKKSLQLKETGFDKILADLLPYSLIKVESGELSQQTIAKLPPIMKLYLVHNQNVLTDFKFLGFPFHYWYTAQFLLILFVILCLVYAVVIDKANTTHDFVEET